MMVRHDRSGFTLVEMLLALVVLAIVFAAIISALLTMQRGHIRQREAARSEDAVRVAEATLTSLLRGAGANPYALTGSGAPQLDPDPLNTGVFNSVRVVSDFNPANGSTNAPLEDVQVWVASDTLFVRWQAGATAAPVAFPIRSLQFEYFTGDGTALTTKSLVPNAARVRFTLEAPRHTRTSALVRRESWVQFRNRG